MLSLPTHVTKKDVRAYKRGRLLKTIKKYKALYLFLLPAVAWFIIFCYVPMAGLIIVTKDYSFVGGIWGSPFTDPWYKNFDLFFNNPELWTMVKNTFLIAALRLILFPAPIVLALMLNEVKNPKLKKVIQTITYFPFFISWVIVTSMLEQLLTPYGSGGPLYQVIQFLTNSQSMQYYLVEKPYFIPLVLITLLWKTIGWNSIVYLAAISNIDPTLYEAANMDGANRLQTIWYITLPQLKTTIGLLFIMALGGIMSAGFEQIYFLQTPSNYDLSNVLDVYVVVYGIEKGKYALASIAGLFQGLIGVAFITGGNKILKKTSDISLW